jgi:LPS-assembly protein
MNQYGKITAKYFWAFIAGITLLFFTKQLTASKNNLVTQNKGYVAFIDTIPKKNSKKSITDSTLKTKDSILVNTIDTLTISKDSIDAPIEYEASDSGVLIVPTKEFILYGKAKVKNKDVNLEAATIEYKQADNLVKAFGATDTTGNPYSKPKLVQGEMSTISDSITFNLKTLKGLTQNTYVQEGEMFINAQVLKKINATEFFGFRTQFTTCNLDTPHFAIRAKKIKLITNKLAISGPASPEFEGVPVPIGIPFGIYPLQRGRSSGILPPAFNVSEDFGLGLEGLGYYKVINDYIDVTTRANIYSYGGWMLNINPKYQKRYKFVGGLNMTIQNTRSLNRASFNSFQKDEFNEFKSFMLNWSHSQDQRVRPGTTFSANVNFGSTRFNQTILNNPFVNFQNQLSSNINYTKDFRGKANISLNANHNQNSNTRFVQVSLPTLTASVVTFYPFQKKEQVGTPKWYEKIGIGYSGNFNNQFSFYDTAFNFRKLLDTIQWGATHSIPISMSLPSLGPITLAPSVTYEERWYGQKNISSWNGKKIDTLITKGFYTARQMSFGLSANTRVFGTFQFKKFKNIQAIRHEIRPNIGLSYRPDLGKRDFYQLQIDSTGKRFVETSVFNGVIPGAYSSGTFGGITFGVDNLLEMKVKDASDTTKKNATKKIKLIDGFGFNSSYNLMADSFALSPFTFYARSTLFEVFNITAGFTLDPYAVDSFGTRKNKFLWTTGAFKPGRILNGNIAVSANFKSKSRDGKEDDKKNIPVDPFMTPDEQQRQLQFARSNPAEFTDFNIPWTLSLNYSLNFSRQLQSDFSFKNISNSSLNFNGDFSLTEKWKIGGTGFIDVTEGALQQFSMFITREMHCWQLSVNVQPIGLFRNFSITLNPKSGILRDLRINRARFFSSQ